MMMPRESVDGVMAAIVAQTSSDLLVIHVSQDKPAFGPERVMMQR